MELTKQIDEHSMTEKDSFFNLVMKAFKGSKNLSHNFVKGIIWCGLTSIKWYLYKIFRNMDISKCIILTK